MDHVKTIEVPATTRQVVTHTTCDLCGTRLGTQDNYEIDDVVISWKTGCDYPEGGSGEITSVDMCSDCFRTKLIPWLSGQGAGTRTKDWDR